jgi:hypothetical protein
VAVVGSIHFQNDNSGSRGAPAEEAAHPGKASGGSGSDSDLPGLWGDVCPALYFPR